MRATIRTCVAPRIVEKPSPDVSSARRRCDRCRYDVWVPLKLALEAGEVRVVCQSCAVELEEVV